MHGLKDAYASKKLRMSEEDLRVFMNAYQAELMQKQAAVMQRAAGENKKAGDAFLAENGKKEGVVTLPSGLQYKILKAGAGNKPTDTDTVECRYRRYAHQRNRVRQLLPDRKAGVVQRRRRNSRLEGGAEADARRLQMADLHPASVGLRRKGRRPGHRAEQHADLRTGTRRHQVGRVKTRRVEPS